MSARQANTEAQIKLIRASAGSGKTYTLTGSYIDRLAGCQRGKHSPACLVSRDMAACAISELLAITFTNAAAAQMRERVIQRLKKAALGLPDADGKMADISAEQARFWLEGILRDMGSLNIRTIDSLLHMIVRASALELNLNPDFEISFITKDALAPYLELFLEKAKSGPGEKLLAEAFHAILNYSKTKGFLTGDKFSKRLEQVIDDTLAGEFDNIAEGAVIKEKLATLTLKAARAASDLSAACEKAGLKLKKPAATALKKHSDGNFDGKLSEFAKKDDARDLCVVDSPFSDDIQLVYEEYKRKAQELAAQKEALEKGLALLPFITLARLLGDAFLQNSSNEGILPSTLIPVYAGSVLGEPRGVSDAICRLGTRLTHFLLDEFQDTSQKQWKVLKPLLIEGLSRGGTLTLVGDVKQSIYGWRYADSRLFEDIPKEKELTNIAGPVKTVTLDRNWRSKEWIVRHNNMFFDPLSDTGMARDIIESLVPEETNPEIVRESGERLARVFKDAQQKYEENGEGYIRAEKITAENSEALNQLVLERLCALLADDICKRRPPGDVMILVRNNEQANMAAEALIDAGIPVITENSLLLSDHPLIIQILGFLYFLANPSDNLAFWNIVSGSIFLGHPDIAPILSWQQIHDWSARHRGECLYWAFAHDFPDIWEKILKPFYSMAAIMTPYDTIMEWYKLLDVEQRFADGQTFLRRFLEVLQRGEDQGAASVASFLEYWELNGGDEKAPMPEYMDAVRIMTIHKAKGLEAPVTMLPWTNFQVKASERAAVREVDGLRLPVLLNLKAAGDLHWQDIADQALEAINLLYVAFTRPKEELYYFNTAIMGKEKAKFKTLHTVIEALADKSEFKFPYEIGKKPLNIMSQPAPAPVSQPVADDTGASSGMDAENMEDWRPMKWLPRLKIFRAPASEGHMTAEQRGLFLHFCLERMQFDKGADHAAQAAFDFSIKHSGIYVPEDQELRDGLLSALAWLASIPQATTWLKKGWPEQSMLDSKGEIIRADLLARQPGGTLVIDYKSGEQREKYLAQIRKYLECLDQSGNFPGKNIGIIVYLDLRRFQIVSLDNCSGLLEKLPEKLSC